MNSTGPVGTLLAVVLAVLPVPAAYAGEEKKEDDEVLEDEFEAVGMPWWQTMSVHLEDIQRI